MHFDVDGVQGVLGGPYELVELVRAGAPSLLHSLAQVDKEGEPRLDGVAQGVGLLRGELEHA
jgi:hypothetical protein